MPEKLIKIAILLGLSGFVVGTIGWFTVRYVTIDKAAQRAAEIIGLAYETLPDKASDDDKVIAITKQVFETFTQKNPASIPLYRIRPYITNKRLPESIRFPSGVMETNVQMGLCDNAGRMLSFLLKQEGFDSVQWNMVTETGGHSAVMVKMPDGREVFVDPFYGLVAVGANGRLVGLQKAQDNLTGEKKLTDVLITLDDNSDLKFYKRLTTMRMAAEGEPLTIVTKLPRVDKSPILLGEINEKESDVKSAAIKNGMMPYWQYMGHKYNREWVRILKADQSVRLVMTLVAPAEEGVLTATPAPKVDGDRLIWNLGAGDSITFRDGLARISLKRMNSYIGVDQIAIYPMN